MKRTRTVSNASGLPSGQGQRGEKDDFKHTTQVEYDDSGYPYTPQRATVVRKPTPIPRRELNTPRTKYREKVGGFLKVIPDSHTPQTSPIDENPSVGELATPSTPSDPHNTAVTSLSENGTTASACGRLIKRQFIPHELPALIEAIFSSKGERDSIDGLLREDAQSFIDVVDEVCFASIHATQNRHLCILLYRHWID